MSTTTQTITETTAALRLEPEAAAAPAPASNLEAEGYKMGSGPLAALTQPPTFATVEETRAYLKRQLVIALRLFAQEGYDLGVAGHITVRDPEHPDTFWVNPFAYSFAMMTVEDLILVSEDGKVLEGGRPGRNIVNLAGFTIHSAIHKARPDVNAICHAHSTYGKAFASLGRKLEIITQDACTFYEDHALLGSFGGVVVTSSEGDAIVNELKGNKALILQNHGLLTVGQTIQSAVAWYILMEKACQGQLLADAAAARFPGSAPIPIGHEEATFTRKETGSERAGYLIANTMFELIEKRQGHEF